MVVSLRDGCVSLGTEKLVVAAVGEVVIWDARRKEKVLTLRNSQKGAR